MKKRILSIFRYLSAAFLGFWTLAFMDCSAIVKRSAFAGNKLRTTISMYQSIDFNVHPTVSIAAVFQIFMICAAVLLLVLGVAQIIKLHGAKLPRLAEKVYSFRLTKKLDLPILLTLLLTLCSLGATVFLAIYAEENTFVYNPQTYVMFKVGFGPIWLFIFGLLVSAAMLFDDKISAFLLKEKLSKKQGAENEDEDMPFADIVPAAPIEEHEVTEAELSAYTAHHDNEIDQ